jgi:hypothetical protein
MKKIDRAYKHNSSEVIVNQPKSLRAKYDRIVEIVRANPGISSGEIAKLYYPPQTPKYTYRMQGMLLQVCYTHRIKCIDLGYFIVEAE